MYQSPSQQRDLRPKNRLPIVTRSFPAPPGLRVTLPRALSKLGYCSRTQAEQLIAGGNVMLNGRRVTNPSTWVDLASDKIAVDGKTVSASAKAYVMMNKPRGLITTRDDPEGRATVYDGFKHDVPFLSAVGRLDKASEGLLLFTNDTVFAQRLLDPETHVPKLYHVQVRGNLEAPELERMTAGIMSDGELLRAAAVRPLRAGDKNAWIEIELREGRNRQIRRMLEGLGVECLRLVRVAIDTLQLGDLPKGETRNLTGPEIKALQAKVGMNDSASKRKIR